MNETVKECHDINSSANDMMQQTKQDIVFEINKQWAKSGLVDLEFAKQVKINESLKLDITEVTLKIQESNQNVEH